MQDMQIAVALQELAEGCTGDAVLIRTVDDNLVLFVERLQRLTGGGEMEESRDMLGQAGPTHSVPSPGGSRPGGPTSASTPRDRSFSPGSPFQRFPVPVGQRGPLCWLHGTSVRENDMLAYHLTYLLAEA